MADFSCAIHIPEVEGLNSNELTVGRVFSLQCTGPWPEGLRPEKLSLQGPPESGRALKIFEANAASKDVIDFKVTSYTAGQVRFDKLSVGDGASVIDLGPLEFSVQSVIEQTDAKPEPYGPLGPLPMSVPWTWWAAAAITLLLLTFAIVWRVRRSLQLKRLLSKLDEHDSALSPIAEYHQRLRRIRREHSLFAGAAGDGAQAQEAVRDLEKAFRVYFMRRFRLPALDWNDGTLLRAFRRYHRRAAKDFGDDVRKLLREFEAARASSKVQAKDAIQLSETASSLAERMDRGPVQEKAGR